VSKIDGSGLVQRAGGKWRRSLQAEGGCKRGNWSIYEEPSTGSQKYWTVFFLVQKLREQVKNKTLGVTEGAFKKYHKHHFKPKLKSNSRSVHDFIKCMALYLHAPSRVSHPETPTMLYDSTIHI
jgi:hypothetical protein